MEDRNKYMGITNIAYDNNNPVRIQFDNGKGKNLLLPQVVESALSLKNYYRNANLYSARNKQIGYGNVNYYTLTNSEPYSLQKIVQRTYEK
ncbi:hypothetical protein [Prevotella dentasini]|uniref:hypothetical protein n=1 Tax=Prevotella dentasini TaxID=589537 RepID=UPI00046A97BA|nr:hypothetical protein [Prevotella dentasini]